MIGLNTIIVSVKKTLYTSQRERFKINALRRENKLTEHNKGNQEKGMRGLSRERFVFLAH